MKNRNISEKNSEVRHFGYIPQFDKGGVADIDAFERWVAIPEDMEIVEPFIKRVFQVDCMLHILCRWASLTGQPC